MSSRPFCILPWFHQMVQPDGGLIPCCAWQSPPDESLPGINEFFRSEFMDWLRSRMLEGDPPPQCKLCVSKDAIGATSVRTLGWEMADQLGIDWLQQPALVSQDVNLSNLCNIKCRTCSSVLSTKWIADEERLGIVPRGGGKHTESGWRLTDDAAKTIRKIEFCGGEPMLHQQRILEALHKISSEDRLGEVTIDITTNGMVMPSDELIGMVSRAKRVYMNISVDGYGDLNDYIRSDSRWDRICEVVGRLDATVGGLPNVYMGISTVLSTLNANAMEDLWIWLRGWSWKGNTQGMIICYGPDWYDARILPRDFRMMLVQRYAGLKSVYTERASMIDAIIGHLSDDLPDSNHLWEKMKQRNRDLDMLRGSDLRSCNAELADAIGL